ncbi:hypothetical protein [Nostoc sp. KVJ3]|nr:hypothetical protein [Nostoc sp. KVJ3]
MTLNEKLRFQGSANRTEVEIVKALRKAVSKMDLSPFPAPSQTFVRSF